MRRQREGVGSFRNIRVGKINDQVLVFLLEGFDVYFWKKCMKILSFQLSSYELPWCMSPNLWDWGAFLLRENWGKSWNVSWECFCWSPRNWPRENLSGKNPLLLRSVFGRTQPISNHICIQRKSRWWFLPIFLVVFTAILLGGNDRIWVAQFFSSCVVETTDSLVLMVWL